LLKVLYYILLICGYATIIAILFVFV
jgi:hypothetical protein